MKKPTAPSSSRRLFLQQAPLGAAASLFALQSLACGAGAARRRDRETDDFLPSDEGAPGNLDPTCGELTQANIEGPFFSPDSPERTSLRSEGLTGILLRLEGRVLSSSCAPLGGTLLDFWQADDDGDYDNVGFTLRGHQYTNEEGRFRLDTILPGHYLNGAQYRPAHIHVKVAASGHKLLTTQLYFAGDPYNDIDPFIRDSLVMTLRNEGDEKVGTFDFVLEPT